jgi:hypothetical protein
LLRYVGGQAMRVNYFSGARRLAVAAAFIWSAVVGLILWADFGPTHEVWKDVQAFMLIAGTGVIGIAALTVVVGWIIRGMFGIRWGKDFPE